jgi:hypothetical protein
MGPDEAINRLRDEVIQSVREALRLAHQNPQYRSPSKQSSIIKLDPHLTRALGDLKILLERRVSGTYLNPLLRSCFTRRVVEKSEETIKQNMDEDRRRVRSDVVDWGRRIVRRGWVTGRFTCCEWELGWDEI